MVKPIIVIHNITTNEIIEREMNDDEFAEWNIYQSELEAKAQAEAEAAQAKVELLNRLGITAEEAKLLLN